MGVNIDHIATIRQARRTVEAPVAVAVLAELREQCEYATTGLRVNAGHGLTY